MWIVNLEANPNGSHNDHRADHITTVPDGWAMIPDDMELPNFPFGEVTAEEVDGVMVMTEWTPGEIPKPEPIPAPAPALEERVTDLEEALAQTDETAIALFEAQEAQEEINAAQDDALIELFEMIGG